MTASEAKVLADAHLTKRHGKPCAVFDWSACETPTHWRFHWNTVASIEGREDALEGVDPIAVDKRTGAVVVDRKRGPDEACNVAFPVAAKAPVGTEADAAAILRAWLDATMDEPCFVKPYRELPIGWAFVWNAERSLEDSLRGYVGQGPTLVVRDTGEIFDMGSAPGCDERLEEFVREKQKNQK